MQRELIQQLADSNSACGRDCHSGKVSGHSPRGKVLDPQDFEKNTVSDGFSRDPRDADQFVPVPETEGIIDYAVIPPEVAKVARMLSLPVRLTNGKHFGSGGGYGVAHMLYHHAPAMALMEYFSIQDFVNDVVQQFDAVYVSREDRRIVVKRKGPDIRLDRVVVLELAKTSDYYSVVTGYTVSSVRQKIAGELVAERVEKDGAVVWECRAPHSKGSGITPSDAPAD